jgi:SAM-dependent methyltransferase
VATKRSSSSVGVGTLATREGRTSSAWFHEHFAAAAEIIGFLEGDGIHLKGMDVADVGAGDGIIDLGLVLKASPARLIGFDIVPTDVQFLLELARREAVANDLPSQLEFVQSEPRRLPAASQSFDAVVSWSTFEHVEAPSIVLTEIHRVLRPGGLLMVQIWPFYHSQHGSHLWQYFPEGFVQLVRSRQELIDEVRVNPGPDPEWAERLVDEFLSCNGLSLEALQRAMIGAGFTIRKVELLTEPFHVPEELSDYPLPLLGISGVKLLATADAKVETV